MDSGAWVWDHEKNALKFERSIFNERNKGKSIDLKSMDKFKYKRGSLAKKRREFLRTQNEERLVTLNDVKKVASELIPANTLKKASLLTTKLFDQCSKSDSMDSLLWCVLKYYAGLIAYRTASCDEGLNSDGLIKKQARARLKSATDEIKQCESNLSAAYILLISGIDNEYAHHNVNGQLRYSRTLFDQQFFEILYEYIMLVTWITFEYQNWEDIHSELGRILRSDAFNRDVTINPPFEVRGLRHKHNVQQHSSRLTERAQYDRPEVGKLNKLKSPLAEVLYPTLLETKSLGKPIPTLETGSASVGTCTSIGIIGDKLANYTPETLQLRDEVIQQRIEEEELRKQAELREQANTPSSEEEYSNEDDTDNDDIQ